MAKTKEQIKAYNKEYFARPEVVARAKIRNAQRRHKRAEYKKTEAGIISNKKYRKTEKSKELQEKSRLKSRYGISFEEYDKMLENQRGLCSICFRKSKAKLHVDHCHKTDKVRGLLCGNCNRAIGLMKDDIEILKNAINYLSK
ncbi:MAG: endonuclease VII domain-containing protein [Nanoarchaeota archaeon]|nr:endonuclease VII domain-containing protein [Nanoarchaeota archaeon]